MDDTTRLCLACKGKKYVFNYHTNRYTNNPCDACDGKGRLPIDSHDDGYGPFKYVQHRLTTEIYRGDNPRAIVSTTDIRNPLFKAEQMVVKISTGIFTLDELLGICSMLQRLKGVDGLQVNCDCCKDIKMPDDGR